MKTDGMKTKTWWAAVLLSILALALPLTVQADDGEFDTPKQAFSLYNK